MNEIEKNTLSKYQRELNETSIASLRKDIKKCEKLKRSLENSKLECLEFSKNLDKKNEDLEFLLSKCEKKKSESMQTDLKEPTVLYEKKRRRIRSTISYLWDYVSEKLSELSKRNPTIARNISDVLTAFYEHKM
jgi:hypothetical protein